jgi:hypothetical protein
MVASAIRMRTPSAMFMSRGMALGVRIRIADATMVPETCCDYKKKGMKALNAEMRNLQAPGGDSVCSSDINCGWELILMMFLPGPKCLRLISVWGGKADEQTC